MIAIVTAALASMYMAVFTTFHWGFGFSLFCLAIAWLTCAAMACYAIRRRQVQVHQQWMVRSYVITFAFVSFRVLADYTPLTKLPDPAVLYSNMVWASWTFPLLIAEVWMQLRTMPRPVKHRPANPYLSK